MTATTLNRADRRALARAALERLVDGSADTDDFDRVAMCINMCKIRALEIDATLADMLDRTQDAMGACKARHYSHGRFGFDGPGLALVRDAIDACEAIIDASSPLQMRTARDVVADLLYGNGTAARLKAQASTLGLSSSEFRRDQSRSSTTSVRSLGRHCRAPVRPRRSSWVLPKV